MDNNEHVKVLLTKWEIELVDLERTLHEAIEKSRKRVYEMKLEFAKRGMAEPIQIQKGGKKNGKNNKV